MGRNMRNAVKRYVLPAIVGILIGGILGEIAVYRLTPPLQNEYAQIQNELYAHYIAHKEIPNDDSFLSPASKQLLKEHPNQITWDPEKQRLSYRYDKPYPVNISFISLLTAGFINPGEKCIEIAIGPDEIPQCAAINHQNGLLNKALPEMPQ